jgi:PAS domain S-box-containing protein
VRHPNQQKTPKVRRYFRSLSGRIFLVFFVAFLLCASVGFLLVSNHEMRGESDALAVNVGNQTARVAAAIDRNKAYRRPALAQDFINALATNRAIQCVEVRLKGRSTAIAMIPPVIGCKNITAGQRLLLPIDEGETASLLTMFSDHDVRATAAHHRHMILLALTLGLAIAMIILLIGFRWVVGKPLVRLRKSIQEIAETGYRRPIQLFAATELRDIAVTFNEMLERESQREHRIEEANVEIKALNQSLELRVQERTQQLEKSSERLRHLIENFSSGIYIHAEFKPIYANQTLLNMLGYGTQEEFLALSSTEALLAEEERERIWGYHQARLRGESAPVSYDFWALKQSGAKLLVNNRSFAVDWDGEPAVCTTLFDLTDQQEIEKSLAEQQHLMNSLLRTTHEGFWFIDLDGLTTDVNPAMCEILGRPREEIIGKTIFDFVDDENRQIFIEQLERRKEGAVNAYEISLQRADGQNVSCLNNATPLFGLDGKRCGSVGMWTDITEIKDVQHLLVEETERAQAANVAKSEFLAIASHELRTPMNGVLGMADLLLRSAMPEEQKRQVEIIKQSGESLLGLLNEILDISKIESGQLEIDEIDFSLRDMIMRLRALFESPAQQKGLNFDCHIDENVPDILLGDLTRIRQILLNLIGNAIKFTESGSVRISVSSEHHEGGVPTIRFEISDTGIGIDVGEQEKIFEKFTQADSSTTRNYGGTGLGLAICRDLIELLGGEIGVDSVYGEGSYFWFTVPCAFGNLERVAAFEDSARTNRPKSLEDMSFKILLAEDNPINQEIAIAVLLDAGHEVDVVENGREAVTSVLEGDYDAVLMDAHMPEMDGVAATKAIRALDDDKKDIPIIALTANAMVGDREKYLASGMNDYVSKPFDPDRLLSSLVTSVHGVDISPVRRTKNTDASQPPPYEAPEQADAIDHKIIDPIKLGKPDLWRRLVDIYLKNAPDDLTTIEQAIANKDFSAAEMGAHTLKSSSANLGAIQLSDLCQKAEIAARETAIDDVQALFLEMQIEFQNVSSALLDDKNSDDTGEGTIG